MKNVLVTGEKGFLISEIKKSKLFNKYNFISYKNFNDNINRIEEFWLFGTPSQNSSITQSIINKNIKELYNIIDLCNSLNIKLIYASSQAIYFENTDYSYLKKESERIVKQFCNSYIILRIPRVYGINKKKGLIYKLQNNLVDRKDFNNIVNYYSIESFIKYLYINLITNKSKNYILSFKNLYSRKQTINQIRIEYAK